MINYLLSVLMATTDIPVSEDTRGDMDTFEHINTNNDTIEAVTAVDRNRGDLIIWGPYVGRVNKDAAAGEEMSLRVKDGIMLDVATSLIDGGATFNTPGAEVWFDPTANMFTDVEAAGLYGVGPLADAIDANGVIYFYKRRYWITGEDT